MLEKLKEYDLIYLGTPYTNYHLGIEQAFRDACKLAGQLIEKGLNIYSPIAHTHPIAVHASIDPLDWAKWLKFDVAMMGKADAMLIGMLEGWELSKGVKHEKAVFAGEGKPIYQVDPSNLSVVTHYDPLGW